MRTFIGIPVKQDVKETLFQIQQQCAQMCKKGNFTEKDNFHIILQKELSLRSALMRLKSEHGCERITIQTGGTLNGLFLREKLFDYVDIVVAPVLIGGKDTATLIDGDSLLSQSDLSKLGILKLKECVVLENSYLRLRYEVI